MKFKSLKVTLDGYNAWNYGQIFGLNEKGLTVFETVSP